MISMYRSNIFTTHCEAYYTEKSIKSKFSHAKVMQWKRIKWSCKKSGKEKEKIILRQVFVLAVIFGITLFWIEITTFFSFKPHFIVDKFSFLHVLLYFKSDKKLFESVYLRIKSSLNLVSHHNKRRDNTIKSSRKKFGKKEERFRYRRFPYWQLCLCHIIFTKIINIFLF